MALRVAINGFGRIGRLVFRAIAENHHQDLEVVAINDLADIESNAYLLRYDSVHGRFPYEVKTSSTGIDIGFGEVKVLAQADPENLPWKDLNIDIVLECSGRFTEKSKAEKHLKAGAKRVLISAPAEGADLTVVYGVNHDKLSQDHIVVSNASCTTNCLAPVASVLQKAIGIERGYMTTIHAYTGDQRLVDTYHSDPRRSRASALSMIPTSTGAAKAVGLVLPELKGKLDGTAIRVPTPNVSLIDFKFDSKRETTAAEINGAIEKAAQAELKGILGVVNEPLVSIDFNHNPLSSSFDLTQTQVIEGRFCRVLSWYDNEWGFSNRMADTAKAMGKFL
ncbi:MAG: type I glyceraldehyde-3-phosphate dehydrogenase [Candidatus Paracaedimonas acanthamoebae]|uniref:Glyceraldehyde-3-phosphate dehydrogenase n=1 Tax=Candidatus Paracaedimonas acanthamoebae TaxID=244581 RepID=A0A8J7PW00_9PROT|nr:type I glyceraldehyde-3-phosphate dehydrogenase [Candidatus Paracaedimonas acanthamoebae]